MNEPQHGLKLWVLGARPRTLGASVVPVIVGIAAAGRATPLRALGCLVVGLFLQIGVNYANDYFDGRNGVDTHERVGPVRLTATGLASPRSVLMAALACIAVAGFTGLAIAIAVDLRLLWVGALAIVAALAYSGGPKPYASAGLGELFVFVFFGLVAVAGTAYVNAEGVSDAAWWSAVPMGLLAVAILLANNLRDIPTDETAGKRTLPVRIGDRATRTLYRVVVLVALIVPLAGVALERLPVGALLSVTAALVVISAMRSVGTATGMELVKVLQTTAILHAQFGLALAVGLWLS